MRRIFTRKNCLISFGIIAIQTFSASQCFSQVCIPVTTVTNCLTGATETFNNDATIGTSGFSGDFTLVQQGNDKFLETTFTGTNGVRSVISRTYVAPALNGVINLRFDLSGNAATSPMEILVRTQTGDIPLCAPPTTGTSGLNCFSFLTPLQLANQPFKFVIRFTISGNNRVIQFDDFGTNVDISGAALPVSFISFDAAKENNATRITWTVGVEENLQGYEIEKSTNGREFNKIGFVPANGQTTYSYTDAQLTEGTVFYRIKNVDNDGKFKYSNILSIRNGSASLVLKAFPLPVINNLTVQHEAITSKGKINISSSNGSIVRTVKPAQGSIQTIINLTGLRSGIYILYFDRGDGKLQTIKFMKQ